MTSIKFEQEKQEVESLEDMEYEDMEEYEESFLLSGKQRATYQFISGNNTRVTMYIHEGKEHSPKDAVKHFKKCILHGEYAYKSSTPEVFIRENHDAVLISKHDDYDDTSYKYDVTNSQRTCVYTSEITVWTLENSDERKFYPIFKGSVEEFICNYE
tara:strand:+ start:44 stop:514 length:471 start_codon:yes stop_codon:yes gene_type:complete